MVSIEFVPSHSGVASPRGSPSYSLARFRERFSRWTPDWKKAVRRGSEIIRSDRLPLASLVYASASPTQDGFSNGDTLLLFEDQERFLLIQVDFFTRLLFTEQKYLRRRIHIPGLGETCVGDALAHRRIPNDPFWRAAGLPGVPIAIGVNGSLRSDGPAVELLSLKKPGQQGEMGSTVGPPVSAGAKLDQDDADLESMTLHQLVSRAFQDAYRREARGLPLPPFELRRAWLDAERGHKPEVNFACTIDASRATNYASALRQSHAGTIKLSNHLSPDGSLLADAEVELERWGLNFQAWFLWE